MRRFDIDVDGNANPWLDRDYCENGEFVDAEVAQEMYDAMKEMLADYKDAWLEWDNENKEYGEKLINNAEAALAKARGEEQ